MRKFFTSGVAIIIVVATFLILRPNEAFASVEVNTWSLTSSGVLSIPKSYLSQVASDPVNGIRWGGFMNSLPTGTGGFGGAGLASLPDNLVLNLESFIGANGWSASSTALYYVAISGYALPLSNDFYVVLNRTLDGVWSYSSINPVLTATRIVKLEPETGSTTPTNSVYFNYEVFLSEEDMEESGSIGMKLYLHNIDQNVVLLSAFSPSDIVLVDTYATTSGYWRYSTTTNLATGNYRLYAKIAGTWGNLFGTPLAQGCALGSDLVGIVCLEANTAFTVVEDTFIGRLQQDSFGMLNDYATTSTATTTSGYAKACIPWSTSFDVVNCGSFLFIPDSYYLNSTLQNFRNKVATHFPVGYFTDFIGILSTTSASSLTVIDAVVPSGVVGSGARVTLDLNGVLDPILYATTSQFVNESAPNTGSLYSITSYYWNIIVYVLTILYFVRRILGAHIIPHNVSVTEYGSETVSSSGVNERGERITKVHGITKRRKL